MERCGGVQAKGKEEKGEGHRGARRTKHDRERQREGGEGMGGGIL